MRLLQTETALFNTATGMPHGYIFDVPADGDGNPDPIRDMGRFSHGAVAAASVRSRAGAMIRRT